MISQNSQDDNSISYEFIKPMVNKIRANLLLSIDQEIKEKALQNSELKYNFLSTKYSNKYNDCIVILEDEIFDNIPTNNEHYLEYSSNKLIKFERKHTISPIPFLNILEEDEFASESLNNLSNKIKKLKKENENNNKINYNDKISKAPSLNAREFIKDIYKNKKKR